MSLPLLSLRQSAAEVLAYALSGLFPGTLLVDNEVTETGFYYDAVIEQPLSDAMIPLIEERMRACIKEGVEISCMEMMRENAISYFAHHKQPYLIERLQASSEQLVKVYKIEEFADLCQYPLLPDFKEIGGFKILKIERSTTFLPQSKEIFVVRIHGTAFPNKMELKQFLKKAESAKNRDHRILGKEMQLFAASEEACSGCWVWLPKGAILRSLLQKWWHSQHPLPNYLPVSTPRFVKASSFKKNLSLQYPELQNLFPLIELEGVDCTLALPGEIMHALAFKIRQHSYRELPIRYFEWTESLQQVKNVQEGGLFRSRTITADITSIFCAPSQLYDELISSLLFIDKSVNMFGFETQWCLSSRGHRFAGTSKQWNQAQELIVKALTACGIEYSLDKAGAAFYGPRVEVRIRDAIGREWKGPYLGVNFIHPEQLGLHFQGPDDAMHVPFMLTRSMFGSLERFIAILVEHYAGTLPLWLAPEQVRVLAVSEKNAAYAAEVHANCLRAGLRAGVDMRKENLGAKVHAAEQEKIPYLIIVGVREEKEGTITLRQIDGKAKKMELNPFINALIVEEREQIKQNPPL